MTTHDAFRARLESARQGDRAAFEPLLAPYQGVLKALFVRELGPGLHGRIEVDDLLQETLLQAFQSLRQFQGSDREAFSSWLFAIARHVLLRQARRLRAQKRDAKREVPLDRGAAPRRR
jgi:RNA polymerase sigma factor (sigma-70 family)